MKFFPPSFPPMSVSAPSIYAGAIALLVLAVCAFFWISGTAKDSASGMSGDDKAQADLRARLTREQYYVTQEGGTEWPFLNAYWNNEKEGIYIDVVTGQPLFSSTDKFNSG